MGRNRLYSRVCVLITLTILDDAGAPIDNANISYTVDGEEGFFVESFTNGEYFVGGEEAGDFVVDISSDSDGDTALISVLPSSTVEADECHVITQAFEPEFGLGASLLRLVRLSEVHCRRGAHIKSLLQYI